MRNSWTGGQYSVFRALFGLYLLVHFAYLTPWAAELFSSAGMIPDAGDSPLVRLFPNILGYIDSPAIVAILTASCALASVLFIVGYLDKWAAAYMWLALACLFGRNPLIANPSLPYVGWMLLAHLFIPAAPYGSWAARKRPDLGSNWQFPAQLYLAAWVVLALSYSYSGYTKLLSPSWVSGDNVAYVLNNPLARDYFLREFFLWLPPILLKLLTWGILLVELFFALFALSGRARPWIWSVMLIVQFGFAFLLNFPDLTLAMLFFHFFTFDPGWIPPRRQTGTATLYYDGTCALCHGVVRFLLAEDRKGCLRFSPLQSEHSAKAIPADKRDDLPDSIVLVAETDILLESDAVIRCMELQGGLWKLLAWVMTAVPKTFRDWGYRFVGSRRYRIFGRKQESCPIVSRELRDRFGL